MDQILCFNLSIFIPLPGTQTCDELVSRVVEEPVASVEKANNQNGGNLNVIGSDEDFESSEDEPMGDNTDS